MSEEAYIHQALKDLRDELRDSHLRLRQDMNAGFDKLEQQIRIQNGRVSKNETRLTVIETQRSGEDQQAVKRATWVSLLVVGAMSGLWKLVDWVTGQ